jgi:hypothetical protein
MPGAEPEVLFADGTWDLVVVRNQAANCRGGWRLPRLWDQDLSVHEAGSLSAPAVTGANSRNYPQIYHSG